ncbi:CvpA family protein [Lacticigenium naphthae]|uniref:CvpA family protein n=1 Tax=Lacticigenium naphthae TaxID=515351 RepID=UPI0003F96006|nr:CvpA family protein [Lacticigenium naphthae]
MILTLAIILILFIGTYSALQRGLILQLVLTIGYTISFYLAVNYYNQLSEPLEMMIPYPTAPMNYEFVFFDQSLIFGLDQAFYNGMAFLIILLIGWFATRIIGGLLNFVTEIPILKQINQVGGAVLGFVVNYIGIFLFLFLGSMLPLDIVQNTFESSTLARFIVQETPQLSEQVYNWWVNSRT